MGPACAATIKVTGTRSVDIDFTVGTMNEAAGDYPWVGVAGYFSAGTLGGVTHIDVVYETAGPWRLRLVPDENSSATTMQVLLSGVVGERTARIRIKDFRPDPYESAEVIATAGHVDAAYLAEVVGVAFESAATTDQTSLEVQIKQIVFHGLQD